MRALKDANGPGDEAGGKDKQMHEGNIQGVPGHTANPIASVQERKAVTFGLWKALKATLT